MINVHIGPFPPPLGGISVYLYRLSKLERNVEFIDEKKIVGLKNIIFWAIKQIFNFNKRNYIYHSHSLYNRLIFYILSLISIHDFSLVIHGRALIDQYNKSNKLFKLLIRKMLNKARFIQVVNSEFKQFIHNLGVQNKNISVKFAFLPPPLEEETKIYNSYENKLLNFLYTKKPILVANAFAIVFYKDEDLYGLDMCIELTKKLKNDFPNIGFLFALANENKETNYLEKMKRRILGLNIKDNFYFMIGQKELWPIFKISDLMVRATNIDGDAISIREALFFNIPVVASDVVSRPEGCFIFRNRDLGDLYRISKKILIKKFQ